MASDRVRRSGPPARQRVARRRDGRESRGSAREPAPRARARRAPRRRRPGALSPGASRGDTSFPPAVAMARVAAVASTAPRAPSAAHQWSRASSGGLRRVAGPSSRARCLPDAPAVAPTAYHARSSRRGRRANRRAQLSPDDRTDAAVTVKVRRACPADVRVGLIGEGGLLGKWDTSKVNPMRNAPDHPDQWEWVLAVGIGAQLKFKLVTIDPGDAIVQWSQGADIKVSVPHGCTGVEINVDWPTGNPRDAPLTVASRVVVEKPLHDYRVETGGAWLAYGKKETKETPKVEDGDGDGDGDASTGDDGDASTGDESFEGSTSSTRPASRAAGDDGRVVVDAVDAVDLDPDGAAERDTAGHFVRADLSVDEGDVALSEDEDDPETELELDDDDDDEDDDDDGSTAADGTESEEDDRTEDEKLAGGYVVGSHLAGMMGGMHTELVFNAANAEDRGVRVGIVEEGRLVEMWHEHSAGPGEGMRVGDVYLGVVAKVISGMQGVLVDVTGQGPPYSLMQKGVDEPALAWCHATREDLREMEEAEAAERREARERDAAEATAAAAAAAAEETEEEAEERKWARLERRARALNGAAAGGRWAEAWADGVGTGDDYQPPAARVIDVHATFDESYDESDLEDDQDEDGGDPHRHARDSDPELDSPRRRRWRRGDDDDDHDHDDGAADVGPSAPRSDLYADYSDGLRRDSANRGGGGGGGGGGAREHLGWAPWKTHVERAGRDASLTGGNRVVEHWRPGMPVVVQVTRLGSGHKGPRVTARPTLPGRNVVLCPDGEGVYVSRKLVGKARAYVKAVGATVVPDDCALIMRTEAAGVSKEVLAMDITSLAGDWAAVRERASAAVAASGEHGRSPMPRRLLDAATVEQILVRDLFGERIARLVVDTLPAYDAIVEDLRRTGATEETVAKVRLHTGPEDVFEALGLKDAVASSKEERVWLRDSELPGAHLVIQQTEALTAVDVNAGRAAFVSDSDTESVAKAVNVAAAEEMALQLRLRDIGGLVMIDFIDMTDRAHRKEVEAAFLKAARNDRAQVTFLPISPLGVMEVARERLQGNHGGQRVVADIKGMPIEPGRPAGGGPRRARVSRPPPWVTRGRGRGRGRDDVDFVDAADDDDEHRRAERGRGNFRGFRIKSRGRGRGGDRDRDDSGSYHSGSFYGRERRGRGRDRGRGRGGGGGARGDGGAGEDGYDGGGWNQYR